MDRVKALRRIFCYRFVFCVVSSMRCPRTDTIRSQKWERAKRKKEGERDLTHIQIWHKKRNRTLSNIYIYTWKYKWERMTDQANMCKKKLFFFERVCNSFRSLVCYLCIFIISVLMSFHFIFCLCFSHQLHYELQSKTEWDSFTFTFIKIQQVRGFSVWFSFSVLCSVSILHHEHAMRFLLV